MYQTLYVPERGALARLADRATLPLMRLLAHKGESPQKTHWWNNMKMPRSATDHLFRKAMITCKGDPDAPRRRYFLDLRFHLGWWKNYAVLEPISHGDKWFIGWVSEYGAGVSQVPIYGRVRVLIGPDNVEFFGIKAQNHGQISLREIARGQFGDGGPHANVPLR